MNADELKAAGWASAAGKGFTGAIGPIYIRGEGQSWELGILTEAKHSNNQPGVVHGGALMTFADIALGYGVAKALGHSNCVTAQLSVQFVSAAPVGAFISCKAEVVRSGAQLGFARGLIMAGGKTVASAEGIWKVLEPRPKT